MAAKAEAVSSRGATPKHEPPSTKKRLTLPANPVKPTPERVVALAAALDTHREIPPDVVLATNAAISSIARSAQMQLKAADADVPAAASSPVSQDDRHRLDHWLKQREPMGITQLLKTHGHVEVKLDSGDVLKVEKRIDPREPEMPDNKRRPSVYHYIRNSEGKLLRIWCDAAPYYNDRGVWTSSGSCVWVGVTQDQDPDAWARSKKLALKMREESVKRRARQNATQDTVKLNASQHNRVLAPTPTTVELVKIAAIRNPRERARVEQALGIPQLHARGEDARQYGQDMAAHDRAMAEWLDWERYVRGEPLKNGSPEKNRFIASEGKLLTAGQWYRKHHGLDSPAEQKKQVVHPPWTEGPKVEVVKQDVQPPVVATEEPLAVLSGGYYGIRAKLEHSREVDAVEQAVVETVEPEVTVPAAQIISKYQQKQLDKQQARVEKAHKLKRKQERRLKRVQKTAMREENEAQVPATVKVDSPVIKPEASEVAVIHGLLPAPANQPIEEPARKPVELYRVEQMSKDELLAYEEWVVGANDKQMDVHVSANVVGVGFTHYERDLRMSTSQLEAVIGYLEGSKPLPQGKPVTTLPVTVLDVEPEFDVDDLSDPEYDRKIMRQIEQEQDFLASLRDSVVTADSNIQNMEWKLQLHRAQYGDDSEARAASQRWLVDKTLGDRRWVERKAQQVVDMLAPIPTPPRYARWGDLCAHSNHIPALHREEDQAVIREGLETKMNRIRHTLGKHYIDAHKADCAKTVEWVGEHTEVARLTDDGWCVAGAVYLKLVHQVVHTMGNTTLVATPEWKFSKLQRRKNRRYRLWGTHDVNHAAFRANLRMTLLEKREAHKLAMQSTSDFVRWAWSVGDRSSGFKQKKSATQAAVKHGKWQNIFADLVAEDVGYRTFINQHESVIRAQRPLSLFDQIVTSLMDYTKGEKPVVVDKKVISAHVRQRMLADREDRTQWYTQYNPSEKMALFLRHHTQVARSINLTEEQRKEAWLEKWDPSSVKVHLRKPRARPERPANIELQTVIVQPQRDFVIAADSSFAGILRSYAKDLQASGIEVTTSDLKKLGISGETASSAPEYVKIDGEIYERVKKSARR